ncbi:hypothetical protein KOI35_39300 [Actinoplanes bogorensis]|uniref:Uncharacterized protein n=1 Tax=Paractinoplanes bogorensis TaxID=1610840 RepID=A0ABS5Z1K8_9ACTN|nr:hypothetical protein [Actinoplanes bogorensis]MBU2669575.1 hypothetical protein [Actinoplanes bogorensis]
MNNSRRIGALVAMATAAVGMATVTATAPATAAPRGPEPVSNWLGAVRANADSWVKIYFRTDRKVCDVEVRVSGRDVDVDYPGRRNYTSFSRGDQLRPGRTDFAAVSVNPDFDRAGIARLRATIAFDTCGRRDRTQYRSFSLALPVLRNNNHGGPGFPGRPGDGPGRPGDGPGRPGDGPGRPGDGPGRPGDGPGRPHNPGWPTRPTASPSTSPTASPTATVSPTATATTTTSPTATATTDPTPSPTRTWTRGPGGDGGTRGPGGDGGTRGPGGDGGTRGGDGGTRGGDGGTRGGGNG